MQIDVHEYIVRTVVIATAERIDAFSSPALRERIGALIADGATRLVIDLSRVPFLDSAGMAVLVQALKHARQAGGDVKLVWPQDVGAQRILRLTRFDRVFDMAESAEAAVGQF